mmetsp:Transcript_14028/g.33145  ORF Transcript_14028/g.33145 Transcript_14028/m.33145 type:complete len:222 (+) Transcript_14028:167-832(+)
MRNGAWIRRSRADRADRVDGVDARAALVGERPECARSGDADDGEGAEAHSAFLHLLGRLDREDSRGHRRRLVRDGLLRGLLVGRLLAGLRLVGLRQLGLLVGLRGHRVLGRLLGRPLGRLLLGHLERALLRRLVEVEEGLRDLEGAELVVPSKDSVVLAAVAAVAGRRGDLRLLGVLLVGRAPEHLVPDTVRLVDLDLKSHGRHLLVVLVFARHVDAMCSL